MAININSNFKIGSPEPLDTRNVLTKEEMKVIPDAVMPQVYYTVCSDDGQFYLYNKDNEVDPITGKFKVIKTEGGALVFTKEEWEALEVKPPEGTHVIISNDGGEGEAANLSASYSEEEDILYLTIMN